MSRVSLFYFMRRLYPGLLIVLAAVPWLWAWRLRPALHRQTSALVFVLTQRPAIENGYPYTTDRIIPLDAWSVFRSPELQPTNASDAGELAKRYRLVGTIQVYSDSGNEGFGITERKAVLEDLERSGKVIFLRVGDIVSEGARVLAIDGGSVTVVWRGQEIMWRLRGHSEEEKSRSDPDPTGDRRWKKLDLGDQTVWSESRFGVQIEEHRWVYDRQRVMDYYNEVLEDGERLVAVFDSLKPLYDDNRKIQGYLLVPEGEKEFFGTVGLQEGDIVRKVNSMPMTSRRVAESFLRDFASGDLGAVVLEIERAGEPVQLVYELR